MDRYALVGQQLQADLERFRSGDFPVSDDTVQTVSAIALRNSFYKKLEPSRISKKAEQAALDDFVECNRLCGLRDPGSVCDDDLLFSFKMAMEDLLSWRMGDNSAGLFEILADKLGPGPGSSYRHNNLGGFFEKYFQGPVSVTSDRLMSYYRAAIFRQESWALAERQRFDEFGVQMVDCNKLFFAPKNAEIARACCTEAGVNMLWQKAIGEHIIDRLEEWGISLTIQADFNKLLAKLGSETDSSVTLDLKSASNSISLALVESYVPSPLKGWLMLTRSPFTILPDGKKLELNMVSSMGNGFTFPLQTAIFTCVVRACYRLKDKKWSIGKLKDWGVFGDDIIVPKDCDASVRRLLWLLGFTVNEGKSFTVGPFRESCGGDYFKGSDVRGVYIRSLETDPQIFSAINRLNRWSVKTGILLSRTVKALLSLVQKRLFVPRFEQLDAGIHVPSHLVSFTLRYKCSTPRIRLRTLHWDSPESLGYGNGLYVSMLGGICL